MQLRAPFAEDRRDTVGGETRVGRAGKELVIGLGNFGERGSTTALRPRLGFFVKRSDVVGEPVHQRAVEPARARERVEHQLLVEAPHHDDPVERRPVIDKPELSGRVMPDPPQVQIKRGRGAAVQRQLGGARRPPLLGVRKIEIGQPDRALQLVGVAASQKDQ